MLTAADIIKQLGGAAAIASALDLPLTTVASWSAVNFIPDWRRDALLRLALDKNVALSTADFPTKNERVGRQAKAA